MILPRPACLCLFVWRNWRSHQVDWLQLCHFALPSPFFSLFSWICRFIGPQSHHWLCLSLTHWLTDWLTHSRLVNLFDVTLASEDTNLKLVEVVMFADVDYEDRIGNSLVPIWKLSFGHKAKLLLRFWAQGLVKMFGWGYKVESWSRF